MKRVLVLVALSGCQVAAPSSLHFQPDADWEVAIAELVDALPETLVTIGDDEVDGALAVPVRLDVSLCADCFAIDVDPLSIRAGSVTGAQYGVGEFLEGAGFRFLHPNEFVVPDALDTSAVTATSGEPLVGRRGLHLHTLHPIEGLLDVWMPQLQRMDHAKAVVDWVVLQRGNHMQWPGLDDIVTSAGLLTSFRAHTAEILDYAHRHGVTVGVGVQLFGGSNLQLAYDLVESPGGEAAMRQSMEERLSLILTDLPWDSISLSFGEFFGEEPEAFIAAVELAYDVMQELAPGVRVTTVIHVGGDQRVEFDDRQLIYYFLATYADRPIMHDVHTVMFYSLDDDAGGAYHHEDFGEHGDLLLDHLGDGDDYGFFPETAYWVAFDNPVPQFLPLYVRARHRDLQAITGVVTLPSHTLFESGWEWGYWLNDLLSLRYGYTLPASWGDGVAMQLAPIDPDGRLADAVTALGDLQHSALVDQRLAAWLAGRDSVIEFGETVGIRSQPYRIPAADLVVLPQPDRDALRAGTLADLAALAAASGALAQDVRSAGADSPFTDELRDGFDVNAARAAFAASWLQALLDFADGLDPAPALFDADAFLASAETVIRRRHAALHDPDGDLLIAPFDNPTIYDFGYLTRADELCYWRRERILAGRAVGETTEIAPGCAF